MTISDHHAFQALTSYLQGMSLINDNEEVTKITKAPGSLDIAVEVTKEKK